MKETGIIMSGDHPRKILDGAKTMTRRVITPQPVRGAWNATAEHPSYGWFWKRLYQTWDGEEDFFKRLVEHCPYGQVGDRLWVRETWATNPLYDCIRPSELTVAKLQGAAYADVKLFYRVDVEGEGWFHWRPSIFMPRWASRITLEITELRAERLQEINISDVEAEGIAYNPLRDFAPEDVISRFQQLWDSLNAKRGYGWDKNPWVWVIGWLKFSFENNKQRSKGER